MNENKLNTIISLLQDIKEILKPTNIEETKPPTISKTPGVYVLELFEYYRQVFKPTVHLLSEQRKILLARAIEKYNYQNCKQAIDNMKTAQQNDQWLQQNATIDFLFANYKNIEKYINMTTNKHKDQHFDEQEYLRKLEQMQQEL